LLECTVFGRKVGGLVSVRDRVKVRKAAGVEKRVERVAREIKMDELGQHSSKDDCWIALHGKVYSMHEFAEEHPPGPESIWKLCGLEATEVFGAIHNEGMLEDFQEDLIGNLIG